MDYNAAMDMQSHIVEIADDFDMEKIMRSGQCFRVRRLDDDVYFFITDNSVLFAKSLGFDQNTNTTQLRISCSEEEWDNIWVPYFDLDRNYAQIRNDAKGKNSFLDDAMDFGSGLRILRQDAWEMLITFIISQRKNIPAITKAVETLSARFGNPIDTAAGRVFAFPSPDALANVSEAQLRECGLGYRAPYILDAVRMVRSGEINLDALNDAPDQILFEELQRIHGVGKKVANCICLFAYNRTSLVPVDVWIQRVIDEECNGHDPFASFTDDAGIMQQYAFYYMTNR